jgi:hypothetical protein
MVCMSLVLLTLALAATPPVPCAADTPLPAPSSAPRTPADRNHPAGIRPTFAGATVPDPFYREWREGLADDDDAEEISASARRGHAAVSIAPGARPADACSACACWPAVKPARPPLIYTLCTLLL